MLNLDMYLKAMKKLFKFSIPSSLMNLTNFIKESCFVSIMTKRLKQINKDLGF
jgi:hypothetical protein